MVSSNWRQAWDGRRKYLNTRLIPFFVPSFFQPSALQHTLIFFTTRTDHREEGESDKKSLLENCCLHLLHLGIHSSSSFTDHPPPPSLPSAASFFFSLSLSHCLPAVPFIYISSPAAFSSSLSPLLKASVSRHLIIIIISRFLVPGQPISLHHFHCLYSLHFTLSFFPSQLWKTHNYSWKNVWDEGIKSWTFLSVNSQRYQEAWLEASPLVSWQQHTKGLKFLIDGESVIAILSMWWNLLRY